MGLELDLVSEHLAMAAGSRLEGVTDEVPLLARTKDIDVLSDSRPVAYDNFHPLKAQTKVKEVEVVCDKVDGLQASRSGEEDNAPLLEKSRVASDERQDEIITTSNCCSSSSKGVEQELHHAPASNGIPAQSDSLEEMEVKYAAYVRSDAYGTWGAGQWTLCEIIKLGFAAVILAPIRVVLLLSILVLFYLICRICTLFRTPSEQDGLDDYGHLTGGRRSVIVNSGRFCARLMLFVLGFYQINVTESDAEVMNLLQLGLGDAAGNSSLQAGAIVSNHISYLDILYHMSASFPSFVAKRSVARIPLVGLISKCLGCIYVQRESKTSDFKGVSGVVVERLQAASQNENAPSVLLFPEGTTTNGDYLLPFKTGAFVARTPVLPVILRYPYERFSPAWDTITGVRHICLLLCQFINYLEVKRLPVYYPTAKECSDPKLYAQNVRRLMAAEGKLTLSEIGLPEKRIYHAALREMRCGSYS